MVLISTETYTLSLYVIITKYYNKLLCWVLNFNMRIFVVFFFLVIII